MICWSKYVLKSYLHHAVVMCYLFWIFEPQSVTFFTFSVFVLRWECHVLSFESSMTPGLLFATEEFLINNNNKSIHKHTVHRGWLHVTNWRSLHCTEVGIEGLNNANCVVDGMCVNVLCFGWRLRIKNCGSDISLTVVSVIRVPDLVNTIYLVRCRRRLTVCHPLSIANWPCFISKDRSRTSVSSNTLNPFKQFTWTLGFSYRASFKYYDKGYQQMPLSFVIFLHLYVSSLHVSGLYQPIIRGIPSCCLFVATWFM